jgi:hypothetical protein
MSEVRNTAAMANPPTGRSRSLVLEPEQGCNYPLERRAAAGLRSGLRRGSAKE